MPAKTRAVRSCQSNLKQIGLGLLQYSQDYDEKTVSSEYGGPPPAPYIPWMNVTQPYIKSTQIFNCPSDSSATLYANTPKARDGSSADVGSYGMNSGYYAAAFPGQAARDHSPRFQRLSRLAEPSTTVWVADKRRVGNTFWHFCWPDLASQPSITAGSPRVLPDSGCGQIIERHLETTNVLFCDGHVKALKLDALVKVSPTTTAYAPFTIDSD